MSSKELVATKRMKIGGNVYEIGDAVAPDKIGEDLAGTLEADGRIASPEASGIGRPADPDPKKPAAGDDGKKGAGEGAKGGAPKR